MNGVLRPSNCRVEGVSFADPIQVGHPEAHWTTLVLFPLWNPFVAWLLVVLGMLGGGYNAIRTSLRTVRCPDRGLDRMP